MAESQTNRPDQRKIDLAAKQRRQEKEVLSALRQKVRERLAQRVAPRQSAVSPQPRYDEVFVAGTEWLDGRACAPDPCN